MTDLPAGHNKLAGVCRLHEPVFPDGSSRNECMQNHSAGLPEGFQNSAEGAARYQESFFVGRAETRW